MTNSSMINRIWTHSSMTHNCMTHRTWTHAILECPTNDTFLSKIKMVCVRIHTVHHVEYMKLERDYITTAY